MLSNSVIPLQLLGGNNSGISPIWWRWVEASQLGEVRGILAVTLHNYTNVPRALLYVRAGAKHSAMLSCVVHMMPTILILIL